MTEREEVIELQKKQREIEEALLLKQKALQETCGHETVVDSEDSKSRICVLCGAHEHAGPFNYEKLKSPQFVIKASSVGEFAAYHVLQELVDVKIPKICLKTA
jgi:tRNA G26 N,N-dimethylase Trm1